MKFKNLPPLLRVTEVMPKVNEHGLLIPYGIVDNSMDGESESRQKRKCHIDIKDVKEINYKNVKNVNNKGLFFEIEKMPNGEYTPKCMTQEIYEYNAYLLVGSLEDFWYCSGEGINDKKYMFCPKCGTPTIIVGNYAICANLYCETKRKNLIDFIYKDILNLSDVILSKLYNISNEGVLVGNVNASEIGMESFNEYMSSCIYNSSIMLYLFTDNRLSSKYANGLLYYIREELNFDPEKFNMRDYLNSLLIEDMKNGEFIKYLRDRKEQLEQERRLMWPEGSVI